MSSHFRRFMLRIFAVPMVLTAMALTCAAPASAQTGPLPRYCSKQIPADVAWKNLVQTFSCVTVETQTFFTYVWACIPSPTCTPGAVYYARARRTTVPNILLARSAAINAVGPPTCVLQPLTTDWTPWTVCNRVVAPARLLVEGAFAGL